MDWETKGLGLKRKLTLAIVIVIVLGGLVQMAGRRLGYFGDFSAQNSVVLEQNPGTNQNSETTQNSGTLRTGAGATGTLDAKANPGKQLAVYIVGAVKKPGVYYVPEGTRLHQLVDKAGGATSDAALTYVNLAQPLQDGIEVVIPTLKEVKSLLASQGNGQSGIGQGGIIQSGVLAGGVGQVAVGGVGQGAVAGVRQGAVGGTGTGASGLVNLNTATAEQLETLPGIGPSYAQRILDYRTANGPFKSLQDLDKVSGIGAKRLAQLKDKVTVR